MVTTLSPTLSEVWTALECDMHSTNIAPYQSRLTMPWICHSTVSAAVVTLAVEALSKTVLCPLVGTL